MKRANLIANGKVQKVGYRDFVQDIARELGIVGYVENLEDGAVKVVCEGDGAKLESFISHINVQKDFIAVQELAVNYEAPTGEFTQFRIKYGDMHEELGDRLGTALLYLATTNQKLDAGFGLLAGKIDAGREENKQGFSLLAGKTDQMLEKQDQMLEKQDKMLEKQDTTIGAIESLSEKIDHGKEEIVTELRTLRADLKPALEARFAKIEDEIEVIKAKIGMV